MTVGVRERRRDLQMDVDSGGIAFNGVLRYIMYRLHIGVRIVVFS